MAERSLTERVRARLEDTRDQEGIGAYSAALAVAAEVEQELAGLREELGRLWRFAGPRSEGRLPPEARYP